MPAMLLALAILFGPPAIYVLGYLFACDVERRLDATFRTFGAEWQCALYRPAARLESALTGVPVKLIYEPIRLP